MIYREYLVMRKALAWYTGLLVMLAIAVVVWSHGPGRADAGALCLVASWAASIFASIFCVALGNASREASRVLWVLPAARWRVALQAVAVDLAGITASFCLAFLVFHICLKVSDAPSAGEIAWGLSMPYAVYGWGALLSMLGRRVPYFGVIALPALILWMNLAQWQSALGAILRAPIVVNPVAVSNTAAAVSGWEQHKYTMDSVSASLQWLGTVWEAPLLIAIAIITCVLAIALWQRAEAI